MHPAILRKRKAVQIRDEVLNDVVTAPRVTIAPAHSDSRRRVLIRASARLFNVAQRYQRGSSCINATLCDIKAQSAYFGGLRKRTSGSGWHTAGNSETIAVRDLAYVCGKEPITVVHLGVNSCQTLRNSCITHRVDQRLSRIGTL